MPNISPWETLYLWHLIGRRGAAAWKDRPASSSIKAQHRNALVRHGFIEVTKGPRGVILAEVTDAGWAWATEHLDSTLPDSKGAALVLRDWMSVLAGYLAAHRLGLGDLFVTQPIGQSAVGDENAFVDRIRERYLTHTNGRWHAEVRLSDLKSEFSADEHEAIDNSLVELTKRGAAELLPIDDPTRISDRDEAAAISIAGERRHLVFLRPKVD